MAKKRSKFEDKCAEVLEPVGFAYEPFKFEYTIVKSYTPDFVYFDRYTQKRFLVEAKGWFRPEDRQKYLAIHRWLDENTVADYLVFLLQYPDKKCSKHNKITMSQWCDKYGIRWFATPEEVCDYVLDPR